MAGEGEGLVPSAPSPLGTSATLALCKHTFAAVAQQGPSCLASGARETTPTEQCDEAVFCDSVLRIDGEDTKDKADGGEAEYPNESSCAVSSASSSSSARSAPGTSRSDAASSSSDVSADDEDDSDAAGARGLLRYLIARRHSGDRARDVLEDVESVLSELPGDESIISEAGDLESLSEDHAEDRLWSVLLRRVCAAISRIPEGRRKLPEYNSLEDAVSLLRSAKRILVLTGAGVSTSCGIPDFRSREGGIYARLEREYDLPEPECMFDMAYFRDDPEPFFSFARDIYPGRFVPSLSHFFIRELEARGKLLRNYTQNIDTLEQVAGVTRVVQCHGSFATATCLTCKTKYSSEDIREDIMAQRVPRCARCTRAFELELEHERDAQVALAQSPRRGLSASLSTSSECASSDGDDCDSDGDATHGVIKPDIVFFGEDLGDRFYNSYRQDRTEADALIVIGSSLKVAPVSRIVEDLPGSVPQILINREVVGQPSKFDIELLGDCDLVLAYLAQRLGWIDDIRNARNAELCRQSASRLPDALPHPGAEMSDEVPECDSPVFVAPNRHIFGGALPAPSLSVSPNRPTDGRGIATPERSPRSPSGASTVSPAPSSKRPTALLSLSSSNEESSVCANLAETPCAESRKRSLVSESNSESPSNTSPGDAHMLAKRPRVGQEEDTSPSSGRTENLRERSVELAPLSVHSDGVKGHADPSSIPTMKSVRFCVVEESG